MFIVVISSVVDPNTLNLYPDPDIRPNLDPDPDPGLKYKSWKQKNLK